MPYIHSVHCRFLHRIILQKVSISFSKNFKHQRLMFKFSCVLGITVYQCIQCECTWRWAYRNCSACGVYRWVLQARLHRRTWGEEERTGRKWRGSVWNIEICEIAWKTWGESLIRWGCDILGWVGLRLFGVRVQYNKAPAASGGGRGEAWGYSTLKTLGTFHFRKVLPLISCTTKYSAAQNSAWLRGLCSCPDLDYADSWAWASN